MGIQQYYIDKKIKRALKKAIQVKDKTSLSRIKRIAIFVDENSAFDSIAYKKLQNLFKLDSTHFKILTYKDKKSSYNEFNGVVVIENDINWQGNINSKDVNDFLNNSFDILIDYTQHNNQSIQLIVAKIDSKLKVGYKDKNDELYDFMINVGTSEINMFNKEMIYYLSIMNLI